MEWIQPYLLKNKMRVFVCGHMGMVGSAICRKLSDQKKIDLIVKEKSQLDLRDQKSVSRFMKLEKPDIVVLAAAKVGGVLANNTFPARFIYDNLQIQNNIINFSYENDVDRLIFLGSSCIYPKFAKQPIVENALLTGQLEPTNEPYAIAKIAGIKMCESFNREYGTDFRCIMPSNLYGPGDNFHPLESHVIPALIYRFHQAKINKESEVVIWGSGVPKREFLHVEDLASACLFIMQLEKHDFNKHTKPMLSHINVGTGEEISIQKLAQTIKRIVGFEGVIKNDLSKPDGTPRKLMDISKLKALGWERSISLEKGISNLYDWFLLNFKKIRIS